MNLDLNDPAVDPLVLFDQFKSWTEQDNSDMFKDLFGDFGVFLWIYESLEVQEASSLISNNDKMNVLREQIFELIAVWIEADLLEVVKIPGQETAFRLKKIQFEGLCYTASIALELL